MSGVKPAKSISDIRDFFEKKGKQSPELVKFTRRGSVTISDSLDDITVCLNTSDTCDITVTQSAPNSPTFKKPSAKKPPTAQKPTINKPTTSKPTRKQPAKTTFTMKPATFFSQISQAAVEVVLGVAPTPAPGTSNNSISTATTAEPNPPIFTTPEGSFVGAEDQQTPLSKAGDWNSTYEEQVLMDDTNPNLQMVLINNEYYAIDQEIFPSLPAPAQPLQPLPQRATNPRKSKSPGTTLPAKRALPFEKPVSRSAKRTDRREDSEATTSEDMEDEEGYNTTPTTVKKRHTTTAQEGYVSREEFNLVVQRLENLQASYQSIQDAKMDHLQKLTDALMRHDSQLSMHSTTLSRMENQILDTDTRVDKMEANMKSLQHAAASNASWKSTTETNMRKMADQVSRLETGGASNNNRGVDSSNSSSFFFGGMYALRDWYGDSFADPAEMVSWVLKKNHLFCSVERMNIADNENRSNRLAARAMIVTMRTPMMRKEAIIQLKRWLAKEGIMRGVTVCDSFSPDMQTTVRAMGRFADQQKKEGHLHQYRVVNKDGAALLQVKEKRGDNYRDKLVSDQQLASFQRAPERSTPMEQDARQTREVREANRQQPPQQQQVQLEQRRRATGSNVEPVGAQQQQQSNSNKLPSSAGGQQTSSGQQQVNRPLIPQPGAMGPLPADPEARADYYKNVAIFAQEQAADLWSKNQQMGAEMQLQLQGAVGGQPTARQQQPTPRNG